MFDMKKQRKLWAIVVFLSIPILVIAALYSGLRFWESTVLASGELAAEGYVSKTVRSNGVDYFPRQDITVFLILGIDEAGPVKDSGSYNNTGEADVILLAIFDETAESCRILALNRDTMADVPVLGLGGKFAGTHREQLALAHTYGSGLHDSCENTKKAVSDFLNGIRIDYYLAMNLDAVGILNDAVGGVRVTITEELQAADPSLKPGEMVLLGDQALKFVQLRKNVGGQLNVERMQRQQLYMQGFVDAWQKKAAHGAFALETYELAAPYMVTDCSVDMLSSLSRRFADYRLEEIVTPEGGNVLSERYYEFHAEEEKLQELILRLFYTPK